MLTFTKRSYVNSTDFVAIANLINACDAVDKLEQQTTVAELEIRFSGPSTNLQRDLQFWENADGELIGFGFLWITEPRGSIDGNFDFYIHPEHRHINLESEIINWVERLMLEVEKQKQIPVRLFISVGNSRHDRIKILENHGFQSIRYFFTMERNLQEDIPQPQLPQGFSIRHMNGEADAQSWVDMFNNSFRDHWNHHDLTVENLLHFLKEPSYSPELDLIAIAADGTFVAACNSYISIENNTRTGRSEGWIVVLATIHGYRRMGLGKAMLLSGLHKLKSVGMNRARLGVDANNPSGALGLYESVGFSKIKTLIRYVKTSKDFI